MAFESTFDLSNIDGSNGFVIKGDITTFRGDIANSGEAVSNTFDINNDGINDIVVGAPGASVNAVDVGRAYVIFGSTEGFDESVALSSLDGDNGFTIGSDVGLSFVSDFGNSIRDAGDINQDGIDDLLITDVSFPDGGGSSPFEEGRGPTATADYVVFGSEEGFDSILEVAKDGPERIDVIDPTDEILDAGDVNGDGVNDFIVSDPIANDGAGATYVVFGTESIDPAPLRLDQLPDLASLDGSNGFTINGIDSGDYSGGSISGAGDVNGDGIDDVIIGAATADSPSGDGTDDNTGESYVVFGAASGFESTLNLADLDGSNGFKIAGASAGGTAGISVSGAGDINSDGIDDVIIGASNADNSSGAAYVVFGLEGSFASTVQLSELDADSGFTVTGKNEGSRFGQDVSGGGDVNGDGIADIVIGTGKSDESYVIYGQASDSSGPGTPNPAPPSPEAKNDLNPVSGGTAGNDGLIGTIEGDFIQGFAGDDAIAGGADGDFIDGGEGTDTVIYQFDTAGITADLTAEFAIDASGKADALFNIENVIGSDFADQIKGDEAANSLTGRDGNDRLEGAAGDDTLLGGAGADELLGGGGADKYLYTAISEGGDTIADFEVGSDKLLLVGSAFGGLTRGALSAEQFFIDSPATSGSSRIGYNTSTGEVLFDADGNGDGSAQVIAKLLATPGFSNTDVTIL